MRSIGARWQFGGTFGLGFNEVGGLRQLRIVNYERERLGTLFSALSFPYHTVTRPFARVARRRAQRALSTCHDCVASAKLTLIACLQSAYSSAGV